MPKEEHQQPAVPDIPSLRAPDRPGLARFFPRESASTTLSLILIPLALGALGGTGLIAVARWSGGSPAGRASAARAYRGPEPAAQAQAAPIPEADAELLRGALERSGGVRRIHDPSPLDDAPAEAPAWSASFSNEAQAALGAGSDAYAGVAGRPRSSDGGQLAADAPESAAGPGSAGTAAAASGSDGTSPRGPAAFSGSPGAAASAGRLAEQERPKLELYPGSKGFQLRVSERDPAAGSAPRAGNRDPKGHESNLPSLAKAADAAKESSQAAAASASEFRQSIEALDLSFSGPWQQDPILRELHDAVSSAKRAGLDAAQRLESYAAELQVQSNALQVDLAQAQAFSANPFARQVPPVTAQGVPAPPDVSAQLAEIARAKTVIDRLKDQVPRGM